MSSSKKSPRSKKTRRKRRRFTAEFKADVVSVCESGGESIGEGCEAEPAPRRAAAPTGRVH